MDYRKNTTTKKQRQLDSKKTMKKNRRGVRWLKIFALVCVIGLFAAALGAYLLVSHIIADLPEITPDDVSPTGYTTFILDQDGNEIEKLVQAGSNRVYVYLEDIPEDLQNAFIAIEDSRFYTHNGVDVKGILRAALVGVTSGDLSEGASTITQQLIKNTVFTSFTEEKTLWDRVSRKVQEIFLAIKLETMMTKEEILENYLNIINLGQNSLGAQAAAQRYFGKDVTDLTLSECSIIAGITKNPTGYNPINYPENNEARRDKVLRDMVSQGFITDEQMLEAQEDNAYERIQEVNTTASTYSPYTYFTDALIDQVKKDLQTELGYSAEQASAALYSGGLRIYSTQDLEMQSIADEEMNDSSNYPDSIQWAVDIALTIYREDGEIENHSVQMFEAWAQKTLSKTSPVLFNTEKSAQGAIDKYKDAQKILETETSIERTSISPQPQASFVIMDQYTGQVKVLVGGRGEKEQSLALNRATDTSRQPGSTFKIVSAYAPAIDLDQYTLASLVADTAFKYNNSSQVVRNYSGTYSGNQTIRYAIRTSLNTIAVRVITAITPAVAYEYLLDFGFTTLTDADITQATALGGLTYGVTNLEISAAYAAIANEGVYNEPILYTTITDSRGKLLIDNQAESREVISDATAALITNAMQDVITSGTGTRAAIGSHPVAGKTGTTNDVKDLWFVGYTPYYTGGIWTGFDQPYDMSSLNQSWHNAMWATIMKRIHSDLPSKSFTIPSSISRTTRCSVTGCLAMETQLRTITDDDGNTYEAYVSCPTRTEYFKAGTTDNIITICDGDATGHTIKKVTVAQDTSTDNSTTDDSSSNDSTDGTTDDSTGGSTDDSNGGNTDDGTGGNTDDNAATPSSINQMYFLPETRKTFNF